MVINNLMNARMLRVILSRGRCLSTTQGALHHLVVHHVHGRAITDAVVALRPSFADLSSAFLLAMKRGNVRCVSEFSNAMYETDPDGCARLRADPDWHAQEMAAMQSCTERHSFERGCMERHRFQSDQQDDDD